jgi:predicted nucleic acid-binding protein
VGHDGPQVKLVIDTNVVAYFLLGTPKFVAETRAFWKEADELIAPAVWEAELANVVWMATQSRVITREQGTSKLVLAGRLGIRSIGNRTLWHGALSRALDSGVAVYDTLFVELADRERLSLVTFDNKVLKAFPKIAKRPSQLKRGR